MVAVLLIAGACGSGDGDGEGDGPGGLRKLPVGAVGAGRSSATMSGEAAADSSAMIAPAQPVEYRLSDDAGDVPATATAYEVTSFPKDEIRAKVAKALDVDADRVEVGVTGYDWYFSGDVAPDTAVSNSASSSSPACAPDEKCIDPAPPAPPPTVPGVPSADRAEELAREALDAMGVPVDEGRFEVFGEDGYNRTVQFTPTVDGLAVAGLQTQFAFGGEGTITYANGVLGEVKAIGDYPLVSLDQAVERLREGFGTGGVRTMGAPEPAVDPAATSGSGSASGGGSAGAVGGDDVAPTEPARDTPACVEGEPCTSPPAPPSDEPTMTIEPQPSVPLEPQIVEITGAELSLQLVAAGCPGDPVYLVPTFDLLPGPAASVIAVEDDAVAGLGEDAVQFNPCPEAPSSDLPAGKPEPAPMPADAGREPARP